MRTYREVRHFCTQKLAGIFFECVGCSHADRAMFDWLAAERYVDANKPVVDGICDCFEAATAIGTGQVQDFETFERLCGRAVWDGLYQPWKREMGLPRQSMPCHTHIIFS